MSFEGVVFPGQGIQYLGMGKDFYETYPEVKNIFNLVSDSLGIDIYHICQKDESLLNQTEYTQPCILTLEISMYEVLKKYCGLKPKFFAGHSLGEYAALVANNIIPLNIAAKIVRYRGKLMQSNATNAQTGSMAAIIMEEIPFDKIKNIVAEFKVDLANDNSKQQVVISGYKDNVVLAISKLNKIFKEQSIRVVYLAVASPFHSRYMEQISGLFKDYLLQFIDRYNLVNLTSVISNYSGEFYINNNATTLIDNLTKQISGSVKWRQNMESLTKMTKNILEIGPGSPLRGFFKSIEVKIQSINNVNSINKVFAI